MQNVQFKRNIFIAGRSLFIHKNKILKWLKKNDTEVKLQIYVWKEIVKTFIFTLKCSFKIWKYFIKNEVFIDHKISISFFEFENFIYVKKEEKKNILFSQILMDKIFFYVTWNILFINIKKHKKDKIKINLCIKIMFSPLQLSS